MLDKLVELFLIIVSLLVALGVNLLGVVLLVIVLIILVVLVVSHLVGPLGGQFVVVNCHQIVVAVTNKCLIGYVFPLLT